MRIACLFLVMWCVSGIGSWAAPPLEDLERLGAKVKLVKNELVEINVDVSQFTPAEYRLLGACTTLKKLTMDGKTLNDETLPLLATLTELEELSTNQSSLSDEGYSHFRAFQNLRSLSLWHPSWDSKTFTGTGLAQLKHLPKLERLTYAGSTAGDAALEAVGQISQLQEFSTWHTRQTQAGNQHLTQLKQLKSLKMGQRLPQWGKNSEPSFDTATIPIFAKIAALEKLELFEVRLTADSLKPLQDLKNLKKLVIHTADITEAEIESVRRFLPNTTLDWKPLTEEERENTLVKKLKLSSLETGK